jgi:flavin-dependent dehydrogenase
VPQDFIVPLECFCTAWGTSEFEGNPLAFWQGASGMVIARQGLDAWLLKLAQAAGASVQRGCEVKSGEFDGEFWSLTVDRGNATECFRVQLVVEAAGSITRSPVQRSATRLFSDTLICISADLPKRRQSDVVAGVESCPSGWWYTAPAGAGRQTISLFTDAALLASAKDRFRFFADALRATLHMRQLVAGPTPPKKLRTVCARTSIRRVLWSGSWITAGDAARTVDPLSGAGIGRAVKDGIDVANAVSQALSGNRLESLRAYAVGRTRSYREDLAIQRHYYGAESRWITSDFWARRESAMIQPPETPQQPALRAAIETDALGQELQYADATLGMSEEAEVPKSLTHNVTGGYKRLRDSERGTG